MSTYCALDCNIVRNAESQVDGETCVCYEGYEWRPSTFECWDPSSVGNCEGEKYDEYEHVIWNEELEQCQIDCTQYDFAIRSNFLLMQTKDPLSVPVRIPEFGQLTIMPAKCEQNSSMPPYWPVLSH